jgi:cell division protein FtsZ
MIEISRLHHASRDADLRIKILGLGGAGSNALDRIMLDGLETVELIALNTDVQALTSSVATTKVQLGRNTTRGLGAGGDPEVGYAAGEEGAEEIKSAIEGAALIFLVVGLGGGTGSGAAPLIASYARAQGSLVVVFATMPFGFEGKRRLAQAEEALASLQHYADVVICFENDKLGDAVSPRAGIHEAFTAADLTISQSVRAIASLVQRPGIIRVGFDELRTALRAQNARCLFGFGEADGDNRAHAALERALKSPLMDRGRLLEDAQNVLVNVIGGPNMTLNEVQILMEELNRHISDATRLLFGTSVDPRMGNKMAVMILSAIESEVAARPTQPRPVAEPEPIVPAPELVPAAIAEPVIAFTEADPESVEAIAPAPAPAPLPIVEPEPARIAARAAAVPKLTRTNGVETARGVREIKQEQMTFEPVTRGRFEKSEPTIVDGQDLDVPAFMRRNVRVK